MKKTIVYLIGMCLMLSMVSALVPYTGAPQLPYLVYGHVDWNDQLYSGARLRITNANTGYTIDITTNSNGYWQEEGGNWLTSVAGRPPVMYGDVITIKALDGCGTADTCTKTFTAYESPNEDWAQIDLSLTGELSCPPISCSPCSCGGGSSGGCSYSSVKCERLYPCGAGPATCPDAVYTKANCNNLYPPEGCDSIVCPEEEVCAECKEGTSVCPVIPSGGNSWWDAIATLIVGLGIGGYFIRKKEAMSKGVGVKIYTKRDGTEGMYHKHPGIKGYHEPMTVHRDEKERHPKGELTPLYEKNEKGVYCYKE